MTDPNYTHVSFILDESGSMGSSRSDVIGGFNTTMADQRKEDGKLTVSLCKFANKFTSVFDLLDASEVEDLTEDSYAPSGGTALLDAVGKHINDLGYQLKKLPESQRPGKVVVIIMTDGVENASREFNKAQIGRMISCQEKDYDWTFVYMGANVDAFGESRGLGIRRGNAIAMSAGGVGTRRGYQAVSKGLLRARSIGTSLNASGGFYGDSKHVDEVLADVDSAKNQADSSDSTERV